MFPHFHPTDFIPEYNISSNFVRSLSLLNDNIVLLEFEDDTNRLLNEVFVFDVDMSLNSNVNISVEDVNHI